MAEFEAGLTPEKARAFSVIKRAYTGSAPLRVLAQLPAHKILNASEQMAFEAERVRALPEQVAPSSDLVLILKATRLCNLRCEYCISWAEGANQVMRFDVLVRTLREFLTMRGATTVDVVWHGGEVTMLKPKLLKKALWLQESFRQEGQTILNAVQTNATRLTDEWMDLLAEYDFQVGISLDGPPEVHDQRRRDKKGLPTSRLVEQSIAKLNRAGIRFGVLVVVDRAVLQIGAERVLDYLAGIGVESVHFLPLDGTDPKIYIDGGRHFEVDDSFVPYSQYVSFLERGFEYWWDRYKGRLAVAIFEDLIEAVQNKDAPRSHMCYWKGNCMNSVFVVEPTGEVGPCDTFTGNPNRFYGRIGERPLVPMLDSSANLRLNRQEMIDGPRHMTDCEWFRLCKGGCPHDRLLARVSKTVTSCCGLSPLLKRIETVVRRERSVGV